MTWIKTKKLFLKKKKKCFNPCYYGIMTWINRTINDWFCIITVSILVIMELWLEYRRFDVYVACKCWFQSLLLWNYDLNTLTKTTKKRLKNVSILVIMELWLEFIQDELSKIKLVSFNPCYYGIMTWIMVFVLHGGQNIGFQSLLLWNYDLNI